MKEQRLKFIDMAKGIAVVAMVIGHCYSVDGGFVIRYIYSFHMPLFFITTGVLYGLKNNKAERTGCFSRSILSRGKSLLIPYFVWGAIYQLFIAFLRIVGGGSVTKNLKEALSNLVCFTGSAMWFLPIMFASVLIFFVFIRYIRNNKVILFIAFVLMIVCASCKFEYEFINIILRSLIGSAYILTGYALSNIFVYRCSYVQLTILILLQTLICWEMFQSSWVRV